MGAIWRGLKLGMKSLLLHKLRSGLTVLGIVFGVAAVISMLAVGEGSSRDAQDTYPAARSDQHHHPLGQADRGDAGRRAAVEAISILNYGLKYSDYDRLMDTVPTIKKALPIREIRSRSATSTRFLDGRVVGTTHDYDEFNRLEIVPGPVPHRGRQRQGPELRRARRRDGRDPLPLSRTRSTSRSSWHGLLQGRSASPRTRAGSAAIGGSMSGQDFNKDVYIPLNTCKLRFGDRIISSRAGSIEAEETQLTQITVQVGVDRRGPARRTRSSRPQSSPGTP